MIEKSIFSNLLYNETFARKTLPFLKEDYFQNKLDKKLYKLIDEYVEKYNSVPSKAALVIGASEVSGLNDEEHKLMLLIS